MTTGEKAFVDALERHNLQAFDKTLSPSTLAATSDVPAQVPARSDGNTCVCFDPCLITPGTAIHMYAYSHHQVLPSASVLPDTCVPDGRW